MDVLTGSNIPRRPGEPFNPYTILAPQLAVLRRADLSDGAKLAYIRLAMFAGRGGRCNPSMETLAQEIGRKDPRRARSAIEELERVRLIRREVNRGRKHTNDIVFLWHRDFESLENRTQASAFELTKPDATVRSKPENRTQMVAKTGRQRPPNPKENPTRRVASQKTRRVSSPKRFDCEHSPKCTNRLWHVCELIREAQGIPVLLRGESHPGSELRHAKALEATPDGDIVGTVRMLMADTWWFGKSIGAAIVHKQLGRYRKNAKPQRKYSEAELMAMTAEGKTQ